MECFIFYHFSSFGYVWFRKFGYEKFEGKCMGSENLVMKNLKENTRFRKFGYKKFDWLWKI